MNQDKIRFWGRIAAFIAGLGVILGGVSWYLWSEAPPDVAPTISCQPKVDEFNKAFTASNPRTLNGITPLPESCWCFGIDTPLGVDEEALKLRGTSCPSQSQKKSASTGSHADNEE